MNFAELIDHCHANAETCFQKFAEFEGRASRSEYWYWVLCMTAIAIMARILMSIPILGGLVALAYVIFSVIAFVPSLAVSVRRLHDINRSGWWLLIGFIPFVGALVLIYWYCQPGTRGSNMFGSDPLEKVE